MNLSIVLDNYRDRPAEELRGYLQGYVDAYAEIEEQNRSRERMYAQLSNAVKGDKEE